MISSPLKSVVISEVVVRYWAATYLLEDADVIGANGERRSENPFDGVTRLCPRDDHLAELV